MFMKIWISCSKVYADKPALVGEECTHTKKGEEEEKEDEEDEEEEKEAEEEEE